MEQSIYDSLTIGAPDNISIAHQQYKLDTSADKVNLAVGAYRDDTNSPVIFNCVAQATLELIKDKMFDHEYLPPDGAVKFTTLSRDIVFGANISTTKHIASAQCLSGTGSLRIALEFLQKNLACSTVYISNPTWANHEHMVFHCNMQPKKYRYWNEEQMEIDFEGMISDLERASERSIIILHASGHNPTGLDISQTQWTKVAEVCKQRRLIPLFDNAYQGFVSGNLHTDAWAIRHFSDQDMELVVAQSFAKSMGLYGERVGCLHFLCKTKTAMETVLFNVKRMIRAHYSNPPAFGSKIVSMILGNSSLYDCWISELATCVQRMNTQRMLLYKHLHDQGICSKSWQYIKEGRGMFLLLPLSKNQIKVLQEKYRIYLTDDGRISLTGINSNNVGKVTNAIASVLQANID